MKVKRSIQSVLDANIGERSRTQHPYTRRGGIGHETREARQKIVYLACAQLWDMQYRIQDIRSLREKHILTLAERWKSEQLSASTLCNRLSTLRTLSEWIGKPGLVKDPSFYFPDGETKRTSIAEEDLSWDGNGIHVPTILDKALQIDPVLHCLLSLQHHLGFRTKESLEFRPANSLVEGGSSIELYEGTKGGRLRRVPLDTTEKQTAFSLARDIAASHANRRVRWNGLTLSQSRSRFYNLVRRHLGISREEAGTTPHGLRHGYAQREYALATGMPPPIRNGRAGDVDIGVHDEACMKVSRDL